MSIHVHTAYTHFTVHISCPCTRYPLYIWYSLGPGIQCCTFIGVRDSLHTFIWHLHVLLHLKCCGKHNFECWIVTILPWSKVTMHNLQASHFTKLGFHSMPIAAVSTLELERRAPVLAGGPQKSPESSSLVIFWPTLFFIIIHLRYKGWIWGS